jgi:glycosyltransferase involved in cell wall biosynthesis
VRIAIVNALRVHAGGTETYLHTVIPALASAGHQLAFLYRFEASAGQETIFLPRGTPAWGTERLSAKSALSGLREWAPDVIFVNSAMAPDIETELPALAPIVLFAHDYGATCISGYKMFAFPRARPCNRIFGPSCLLHYYPCRCGGLNPLTMWRDYRSNSARLARLHSYAAVLTASNHMRQEYLRHGLPPSRVHLVPYPVLGTAAKQTEEISMRRIGDAAGAGVEASAAASHLARETPFQLLFCGRMTRLKGGHLMLDALPLVIESLRQPIRAVFAGDGPQRQTWEKQARRITRRCPEIAAIEFTGWLDSDRLDQLCRQSDLLVVSSVWPEPLGVVGLEAAIRALPAAAFAVGGIPDWLTDGVNGYLAPGDPPTAAGLAAAIVKCLRDPRTHTRLRDGARQRGASFSVQHHLGILLSIFAHSAGNAFPV